MGERVGLQAPTYGIIFILCGERSS